MDPLLTFLDRLFIPDVSGFTTRFDVLKEKFSFIEGIIDTGAELESLYTRSVYANPEPPVIYVDFDDVDSEYDWGGKVAVLDFSFYAPYKAKVDLLLSGILLAFFAWRVYLHLPGLISGSVPSVDDWGNLSDVHSASESTGKYQKKTRINPVVYRGKFQRK